MTPACSKARTPSTAGRSSCASSGRVSRRRRRAGSRPSRTTAARRGRRTGSWTSLGPERRRERARARRRDVGVPTCREGRRARRRASRSTARSSSGTTSRLKTLPCLSRCRRSLAASLRDAWRSRRARRPGRARLRHPPSLRRELLLPARVHVAQRERALGDRLGEGRRQRRLLPPVAHRGTASPDLLRVGARARSATSARRGRGISALPATTRRDGSISDRRTKVSHDGESGCSCTSSGSSVAARGTGRATSASRTAGTSTPGS